MFYLEVHKYARTILANVHVINSRVKAVHFKSHELIALYIKKYYCSFSERWRAASSVLYALMATAARGNYPIANIRSARPVSMPTHSLVSRKTQAPS